MFASPIHLKPDLESLIGDTRSLVPRPALRDNQLEEGEIPELIEVKFDDLSEKIKIYLITIEFDGNRGYGKIQRRMLPVILCWAVTVHKLQGCHLFKQEDFCQRASLCCPQQGKISGGIVYG